MKPERKKRKRLRIVWIVFAGLIAVILLSVVLPPFLHSGDSSALAMYKIKNCSGHSFQKEYTSGNGYLCEVKGETEDVTVTVPAEYKRKPVVAVRTNIFPNETVEAVVVEEGISYVEDAFANYRALRSVRLPSSLKALYGDSFSGCRKLESVEFSGELELVDASAFRGCEALREVIFHSDVGTIGKNAFSGCPMLETVVFKGAVERIETGAFSGCPKLTDIQLPENAAVEVGAFSEDTVIRIGDGGVYYYSKSAYDKEALTEKAKTLAGQTLPEDKKLREEELPSFAQIWNGPMLTADKIADCDRRDYAVDKLPEELSFAVTDVFVIEEAYPGTVYTKEKEERTLSGEMPLIFCVCELTGYSEGPEYIFGGVVANYLGYRFSFLDASDGEVLGWYECTVGDAPGRFKTGDAVFYEEAVGDGTMYFFLDENGHRPEPTRYILQLVYALA